MELGIDLSSFNYAINILAAAGALGISITIWQHQEIRRWRREDQERQKREADAKLPCGEVLLYKEGRSGQSLMIAPYPRPQPWITDEQLDAKAEAAYQTQVEKALHTERFDHSREGQYYADLSQYKESYRRWLGHQRERQCFWHLEFRLTIHNCSAFRLTEPEALVLLPRHERVALALTVDDVYAYSREPAPPPIPRVHRPATVADVRRAFDNEAAMERSEAIVRMADTPIAVPASRNHFVRTHELPTRSTTEIRYGDIDLTPSDVRANDWWLSQRVLLILKPTDDPTITMEYTLHANEFTEQKTGRLKLTGDLGHQLGQAA